MRVDFYQLSRDPAPPVAAMLAAKLFDQGTRTLIVAPAAMHGSLSEALWAAGDERFLAHGRAGEGDEALQPILIAEACDASNGARAIILADGTWHEAEGFARAFLLFDAAALDGARAAWRALGTRTGVERRFWVQDGGRWRQGP